MGYIDVPGREAILKIALKDVPTSMLEDGVIKGGHTKVLWDVANADEVAAARATFDMLRKKGFSAFRVKPDGSGAQGDMITSFDPKYGGIIMIPQQAGGL